MSVALHCEICYQTIRFLDERLEAIRAIENKILFTGQILNGEIISRFVCRNTENKIIACV
jgi:hypothetical protein